MGWKHKSGCKRTWWCICAPGKPGQVCVQLMPAFRSRRWALRSPQGAAIDRRPNSLKGEMPCLRSPLPRALIAIILDGTYADGMTYSSARCAVRYSSRATCALESVSATAGSELPLVIRKPCPRLLLGGKTVPFSRGQTDPDSSKRDGAFGGPQDSAAQAAAESDNKKAHLLRWVFLFLKPWNYMS